jgi:hypothetical protein
MPSLIRPSKGHPEINCHAEKASAKRLFRKQKVDQPGNAAEFFRGLLLLFDAFFPNYSAQGEDNG